MPRKTLRIGLIADDLTRSCLAHEACVWNLTPFNYRFVLKLWRPDFVFVESAWQGSGGAWKFKIAAYPGHPKRSNQALVKFVSYARELGIPCVFWNKEDGVHFDRFIESAALFDHIFTVDANCVERYRARVGGAVTVEPLMFAVQPAIHHPRPGEFQHRRACFLGSYSQHIHEERRRRQDMLFTACADFGLTIFDRNWNRKASHYRYPQLPGMEVRRGVPHDRTADIYGQYMVSLNVNTVDDSETMFSRRLVEILASGGLAVTTPARSVDRHFGDYCHVVDSEAGARELMSQLQGGLRPCDREMMRAGADYVLGNHTWAHRLETVLHAIN